MTQPISPTGRLQPDVDDRQAQIYRAVRGVVDRGMIFHVLTDTPEQFTDVFRILVDDNLVVGFELPRADLTAPPTDVVIYSLADYERQRGGGRGRAELRALVDLVRNELRGVR